MNKQAFSLAELSIVLIIIGLLISGVTAGSKLVHQSKINKLINEMGEYKNAFFVFKSTYDALPGDMDNALSYWTGVTNGDGDNIVGCDGGGAYGDEDCFRANLHLVKAELSKNIDHNGNSISGTVSSYARKLESFSNGAVRPIHPIAGSHEASFHGKSTTLMQYGSGQHTDNAFLVPKDAYAVDNKLDDGLPKSGSVVFRIFGTSTDAACTNSSTAYYLSSTAEGCTLVEELGI